MPPASALAGLPTASALPNPASSGAGVNPPGIAQLQPGTTRLPSGTTRLPSGNTRLPSGNTRLPSGNVQLPSGNTRLPAGSITQILTPNGEITNPNVGIPPVLPVTSVSATLANLLPLANSELGHSAGGVYVGDGRPPVPYKLAQKIRRWEFVDMGELLPEFWCSYRDDEGAVKRPSSSRRTRKVTEIFTWVQCFNTYVSVLAPAHPETIPELMAYMSTIVRTSQDFSGLAWVRYDAGFRRQAALTGNRMWSQINATLYTLCFAGNALATTRCELCFASSHSAAECEQRGEADPEMPTRMKAIETAVLALTAKQGRSGGPARSSGEACRLWNRNSCSFPRCKHLHICSRCSGNHQALSCPMSTPQQGTQTFGKVSSNVNLQRFGSRPY